MTASHRPAARPLREAHPRGVLYCNGVTIENYSTCPGGTLGHGRVARWVVGGGHFLCGSCKREYDTLPCDCAPTRPVVSA
jgi:hypothetical protein